MKISALIEVLKAQYRQPPERRRPIFVQGSPGLGKSDAAKQAAAELGIGYMSLQATIEDPITLSGLPVRAMQPPVFQYHDDGNARVMTMVDGTQYLPYAEFLPFRDKLPTAGDGILSIEEINTAPPLVQAGLYDLFLHGKLGSYTMPPGWYVMATGNRDEDRAATQRIPMPLIGRWTRVKVEADLNDWTKWALNNGVRPEVTAFFQYRPDLFNTFDPKVPEPYCCPRTAVFASQIIDSAPPGLEAELLEGTVGEGVAREMEAFMRMARELVTAEEILADPRKAPLPKQPDAACAIAAALAHVAAPDNFERVLTYAARMQKEYEVLIMSLATKRNPLLIAENAFIKWSTANRDVVVS